MNVEDEQWALDFQVSKSIRYHSYRRAFWDTIDHWSKIIAIVSGTSVLVTIVGEHNGWATGLAIVVAVASAADVVIGFSKNARDHDMLYRAFSRLAQDMAATEVPTSTEIHAWRRRVLEIEMDEPFVVDLLERRCSAEEARARGAELRDEWQLKWWQIALSQVAIWPSLFRNQIPDRS